MHPALVIHPVNRMVPSHLFGKTTLWSGVVFGELTMVPWVG